VRDEMGDVEERGREGEREGERERGREGEREGEMGKERWDGQEK
jgi:hypothetical protein